MRKLLTILLLFLFTVTHTEFGQILRLPLLVEHFNKHKQQSGSLSFIEFLKVHYQKQHHDKDQAEDRQLPFNSSIVQPLDLALVPMGLETLNPLPDIADVFYNPDEQHFLPQVFYGIFHPPRTAAG